MPKVWKIKWHHAKLRKVPKVGSLKCLKFGKLNHLTPRLRSATDGEDFKRNGTNVTFETFNYRSQRCCLEILSSYFLQIVRRYAA